MIAHNRWGSNTSTASESDPNEARLQPSLRCTFFNVLACCNARNERSTGLKR